MEQTFNCSFLTHCHWRSDSAVICQGRLMSIKLLQDTLRLIKKEKITGYLKIICGFVLLEKLYNRRIIMVISK